MKNLILCLLLFGFISTGHSQILLKEAKVDYIPESMKLDPVSNELVVNIPEKTVGEFQKDPLDFMKKSFDVQKLINDNKEEKYAGFIVNFKSKKGFMAARFNQHGDLLSSFQKFKDVRLPENERLLIVGKYRDAAIIGNKYIASSKGWDLTKEQYVVKIKDGNKTRRVRIDKERDLLTFTEH